MATRMLQRRGTAAEWAAQNPILAAGEIGFEIDTKIIKIGDGTTPWNGLSLPYVTTGGATMLGQLYLQEPDEPQSAARMADVTSAVLSASSQLILPFNTPGSASFVKVNYPWLKFVLARVQGAGAGGGGAQGGAGDSWGAGSGGGGGGFAESLIPVGSLAASEPITVGEGGINGIVGTRDAGNGGNSSFGTHAIGNGGGAGLNMPTTTVYDARAGGIGGSGTGDIVIRGSDGGSSYVSPTTNRTPGYGGGSHMGGQAAAPHTNGNGKDGYLYGGGGAGGSRTTTGGHGGGFGANGRVILHLFG